MEKKRIHRKTISSTIHEFYCDDCGQYIGESTECDDGYYKKLGNVDLDVYIFAYCYELNKCLCNSCRKKLSSNIENNLFKMGFKREWRF